MSDTKWIAAIAALTFFAFGLLCSKAVTFSVSWWMWPVGILAAAVLLLIFMLSNWAE